MFLKARLTLHFSMSGSRCVTTASLFSGSLKLLLYIPEYSFHPFLTSSVYVRSLSVLFFIMPIFEWNIFLIFPIFQKRPLVFPILLFSSTSLHYLRRPMSLLALLWKSAFSWVHLSLYPLLFASLPSAITKASDNHFAFLHFFFFGMVFVTASCM